MNELGFGIVTCERYPGDTRTDLDLYQEALQLVQTAERLGFDSAWVSEHHFLDDSYMPAVLPVAAAMAAHTERITVGTAIALAPLYHPLRLAEDAATVDLLSSGRFVLGLGQGWRAEEFEALGVPLRGRHKRLEHTVATLRQAWSDSVVTGTVEEQYPDVLVTPKPAQLGGPPIWIGAMAEPAIRRAARIADGWIATDVTPDAFAEQVSWVRDEAKQAERPPDAVRIGLHLPTFPWHGDDAWDRVRDHHYYVAWKYDDMDTAHHHRDAPRSPPPLSSAAECELKEQIILGSPTVVAQQIQRFIDAAGGSLHYVARLYWPGMEREVQEETLRIFAEEVAPLLRTTIVAS